jgi:D-glycero-D-manno-heptose 1,7-bisphosphate phosphatase
VTARRAAFLDRDGTIITDVNYIARPEDARLVSGAADAIRRLNDNGVAVVIVTNQSGIAQGKLTTADYEAVRARVAELLRSAANAIIDAEYYCPHYPSVTGPCDCRKPARLLFDRAVADLSLDPARSMFAGDRLRDVLPARAYGGAAYLVHAPSTPSEELDRVGEAGAEVVPSLLEAVERFLTRAPNVSAGASP